jgi:predicted ATPase
MLEVRLLGKFDVRFNGVPVILSSRAAQSLFAFLILSAGTHHRREKLAGMLWPDAPEEKARAYLRHELWRIRKAFSALTDSEFLLSDDIAVYFDENSEYWLDVDQLTKLAAQSAAVELMAALRVYEGEMLPGFYEDWVIEEREHLHALFEKRIGELLKILEGEKSWHEILEWGEIWLTHSPAQETAYQFLIRAYQALGEHARAAAVYERCVNALREFDIEPSELTQVQAFRASSRLNIPIPMTSFIGRQRELKEIADFLQKSRLVTLTGSGGVGKTRLSIQVVADLMDRFPDGIWFLDLAPLVDGSFIPNTLASLLALQERGDVHVSVIELLISFLRPRKVLIIFDNCEHLIDSCASLAHTLLTSCEQLTILATSREVLRVAGEIPYRVPSLKIPVETDGLDLDALGCNESARLFVERAANESREFRMTNVNAVTIVQICRRLDGIPLAIELAAARVSLLSLEQILQRLDDRLSLLAGGLRSAMPRHQTLRATVEWSYDLLSEKEQTLFRRLAVFSGKWTLDMAEAVCSGEGLLQNEILELTSNLVNKSLLVVDSTGITAPSGERRYRRLEIIREFAREKLVQAGEFDGLMDRHHAFFLKRTEEIEPHLMKVEQSTWMDILDEHLGDIRLALDWSIAQQKGEDALRLFSAVGWFWFIRCRFREGEEWFRRLQPFLQDASIRLRARVLRCVSWLFYARDDFAATFDFHRQCLEMYRELGDEREMSTCLQFMGVMAFAMENYLEAKKLLEQCLEIARRIDHKPVMPRVLMHLGHLADRDGDRAAVKRYYEESLSIAREVGEGHLLMVILGNMGNYLFAQKNYSLAREYYQEELEIGIRLKNKRTIAQTILSLASQLNVEGLYAESARLQGYAESLFSESEALTGSHIASLWEKAETSRKFLGEKKYEKEFNTGRTLQLHQAVDIACKSRV